MDPDIHEALVELAKNVESASQKLRSPNNDSADLISLSRTLRLSAQAIEVYLGIMHERTQRLLISHDLHGV